MHVLKPYSQFLDFVGKNYLFMGVIILVPEINIYFGGSVQPKILAKY